MDTLSGIDDSTHFVGHMLGTVNFKADWNKLRQMCIEKNAMDPGELGPLDEAEINKRRPLVRMYMFLKLGITTSEQWEAHRSAVTDSSGVDPGDFNQSTAD